MENKRPGLELAPETRQILIRHNWPGNVRELMNTMERAVLLAGSGGITPEALLFEDMPLPEPGSQPPPPADPVAGLPTSLKEAEKILIERALGQTDGNRTHAAKILGISVRTLRNKLNEYKAAHGE